MGVKYFFFLLAMLLGLSSCKKDESFVDCFPDSTMVREINDKPATVNDEGGEFFLIEQGAISTKLRPCNLPIDYQVDNLQVTISGKVKATIQGGPGPCCTENFVITKISQ